MCIVIFFSGGGGGGGEGTKLLLESLDSLLRDVIKKMPATRKIAGYS